MSAKKQNWTAVEIKELDDVIYRIPVAEYGGLEITVNRIHDIWSSISKGRSLPTPKTKKQIQIRLVSQARRIERVSVEAYIKKRMREDPRGQDVYSLSPDSTLSPALSEKSSVDQPRSGDASTIKNSFQSPPMIQSAEATQTGLFNHRQEEPQNASGYTAMTVTGSEKRLLLKYREIQDSDAYNSPPHQEHVKSTIDQIMQELQSGVKAFRDCHAVTQPTTAKLSVDTVGLSNLLFLGSASLDGSSLSSALNVLFSAPEVDVVAVLNCYAAAALFQWILIDFQPELSNDKLQTVLKNSIFLDKEDEKAMKQVAAVLQVRHMKEDVQPSLPKRVEQYQTRLYDVLNSLVLRSSQPVTAMTVVQRSTRERQAHQQDWETAINSAFLRALELKVKFEMSAARYDFEFPPLDTPLAFETMEAAQIYEAPPAGSEVRLCLRPSIFSRLRDEEGRSPRLCIVKALVIVAGYPVS